MQPFHKRHKVCSYVPQEQLHHSWWCHGKWHSYSRSQEWLGCLDHIQPIPSHITTLWLQRRVSPFWVWSKGHLHGSIVMILSSVTQIMSGLSWNTPALSSTQDCKWIAIAWREYNAHLLDLSVACNSTLMRERLLLFNRYPLDTHRTRGDLILTFRLFAENRACNFFTLGGELSVQCHDKKILKLHQNTSVCLRSFTVWVIHHWNDLPKDVVSAASLASFKTHLE